MDRDACKITHRSVIIPNETFKPLHNLLRNACTIELYEGDVCIFKNVKLMMTHLNFETRIVLSAQLSCSSKIRRKKSCE